MLIFFPFNSEKIMPNHLSCLISRTCKTCSIKSIVESTLKHNEKNFTRYAFSPFGFLKVSSKLSFKHSVHLLDFLFFTELNSVI